MTQPAEWEGAVGDVWAQEWKRTDRAFAPLTETLLNEISNQAPETGQAIDIGCGAGETSISIASRHPGLKVTGIDLSAELLATAKTRSQSYTNIDYLRGDATTAVSNVQPVNLYFSRHGVMFFDDPVEAFTRFHKAAASNAKMVFSCFRDWSLNGFAHNVAALTGEPAPDPDNPGPFAFASESKVANILTKSGWKSAEALSVDFDYIVGEGDNPDAALDDAVGFLRRVGPAARAIRTASADKQSEMIASLRAICEQYRTGNKVAFAGAAWIWAATAESKQIGER